MVPAIAAPSEDPRLETLRDSPEVSPWSCSGKLDWTMFTDGVSIRPRPRPIRSSPGAKAQALGEPITIASSAPVPMISSTKPTMIRDRWGRRLASRSAASDAASSPAVSAVKITPVSMAL
jgi:hypothetical protein